MIKTIEQAIEYLKVLDIKGYTGEVAIRADDVVVKFSPAEEALKIQRPAIFNEPTAPAPLIKPKGDLDTINWGKPGSKPKGEGTWKSLIVAKLNTMDIFYLRDLEKMSYTTLKNTHGIKGIANIIRDSMEVAGRRMQP